MTSLKRSALLAPVALIATSMATLGLASAGHADPVGVACGDTVTTSVTLTGDLDCTGLTGTAVITVGADDVTVDLGGYTISNTDGYERVIDINTRDDVKVRNGTIYGPATEPVSDCSAESAGTCAAPAYLYEPTGILVVSSTDVSLESLFVLDTGWATAGAGSVPSDPAAAEAQDQGEVGALEVGVGIGVDVQNSSKVKIYNVESVGSDKDGGNIEDSTDVSIKKSSFSDNQDDGLWVDDSSKVSVYDSRFDGNSNDDGLDLQDCQNVSVKKTSMSRNGDNGLESGDCSSLRVHDSIAHANDDDGMGANDVAGFHGHKLSVSYNNDDGFDAYKSEYRLHDSTFVDNDDDGLESDYGDSWRIHKVRSTLNGDDGFDIEDLVSDPSAYRLENNVANTNCNEGFEIDGTVTEKNNSAGGNGGERCGGGGATPTCTASLTNTSVNLPDTTPGEDTTPATQLNVGYSGFTSPVYYVSFDGGAFSPIGVPGASPDSKTFTMGDLAIAAGLGSWTTPSTHTIDIGLAEGGAATSMVCQAQLTVSVVGGAG